MYCCPDMILSGQLSTGMGFMNLKYFQNGENDMRITVNSPTDLPQGRQGSILVSDFDGTMTRFDFFHLALREVPSSADRDFWQDYMAGELTLFEALSGIFGAIRASGSEIEALLTRMELDPLLHQSVERLRHGGWQVIVASAGCDWYINRLLRRAGVDLEVHANPGEFRPEEGLKMTLPEDSPFLHREKGIDKPAVVRDALARSDRVAFAGDGPPDLEAALLVSPTWRFARGWLAQQLEARNEAFHSFRMWSDIADVLLAEGTR